MAIRQFAVFVHFDGTSLTAEDARKLTGLRLQVVSCVDPLKVSAVVPARTIDAAIGMLTQEVNQVAPDAVATSANAIEIAVLHPAEAAAITVAS